MRLQLGSKIFVLMNDWCVFPKLMYWKYSSVSYYQAYFIRIGFLILSGHIKIMKLENSNIDLPKRKSNKCKI